MLSLSRRDVRRWRRAVVERRWRRTVVERRWMRAVVERRWMRAVVERRWMRAVVERRGQSPDACVQRMRATNQGLRYIRRHTTLACEASQLSVAAAAVGAERETLARVRSGTGTREPTDGEKPTATGGREEREKPGQLSLASWDHDFVAMAH